MWAVAQDVAAASSDTGVTMRLRQPVSNKKKHNGKDGNRQSAAIDKGEGGLIDAHPEFSHL